MSESLQTAKNGSNPARVAVIIPCYNDGALLPEAVGSIQENEPIEIVVVDDGSSDPNTDEVLSHLESEGVRVIRHARNRGVSAARMTALEATSAPYVLPLDSDDLANPGRLAEMADLLDADDGASVCYGDYLEFGDRLLLRAVPTQIDPFRVAYTNEYPPAAMFRRSSLVELGGWRPVWEGIDSRSDWSLWIAHAEHGRRGIHLGPGKLVYFYRLHGRRLQERGRVHHRKIYGALKERHTGVFEHLAEHRKNSNLRRSRKALYPLLYGRRILRTRRLEAAVKDFLDRSGVWTLQREISQTDRPFLQAQIDTIRAAARHPGQSTAPGHGAASTAMPIVDPPTPEGAASNHFQAEQRPGKS